MVAYAKSCAQPGLKYFQRQLGNSLKVLLAAFKAARLFSTQTIYLMQSNAAMVEQLFAAIPFFNSDVISHLKEELPDYFARAAETSVDIPPIEWWKRNAGDLPN